MSASLKSKLPVALAWIIGVIAIWEIGAWSLVNIFHDPMATQKLPFLHDIVRVMAQNWASLMDSASVTVSKAALGFLYGSIAGFVIAIVMSLSRNVERVAFPYLIISQMIPILGLAPIIYNIVKDGDTARVVISAYITFFPVSINTLGGIKSVEKDRLDLMYSYAAGKFQVYRKLIIPSAMPYLMSGLKIAAPLSVTAAILVEMLGTDEGIGVKILYTLYYGAGGATMFWASVITSALLGILGYVLISLAEKLLMPWQNTTSKRGGEDA
ncbi:MAG: NitT/TauT family transport system permease protein [Clostridiales bacterium]|jgi:NitT/TauT family transport system permease protein|nr:NitT/TauT family transport system permease protein [Clostridiales bacterium]